MALTALLTRNVALAPALERASSAGHVVAACSWTGFVRLIRERPVTTAGLDLTSLPDELSTENAVEELRSLFPNLGLIVLCPPTTDPMQLLRLGRCGAPNLIVMGLEDLSRVVPEALARASERTPTSLVTKVVSPYLPRRELEAVRLALDGVHQRWSAEHFADSVGLSRPFLSERLRACLLPSTGRLLIWVRLLHAGRWLEEPGRTGESVSRQLEYSSGAAFRRALKLYTGATPTEVAQSGGLRFVLKRFLEACGLLRSGAASPGGLRELRERSDPGDDRADAGIDDRDRRPGSTTGIDAGIDDRDRINDQKR